MMSPILRILATLLSLVMLLTAGAGGGKDHDVKDPATCRLNFAVLSDSHIEGNNIPRYNVFAGSLRDVKKNASGNDAVVFLGDNGSDAPLGDAKDIASSAPLRGKKGAEFEGGTRVPCIIAWARPDEENPWQKRFPIRRGVISPRVGTIMDIYPTLVGAVGGAPVPPDYPCDGRSLQPILGGRKDAQRAEDQFLCHFPHQHRGSYFTTWRHGNWKLIYYYHPEQPDAPHCSLFNLRKDPSESRDVLRWHRRIARRLLREMTDRLESENACYPVDSLGQSLRPRPDAYRTSVRNGHMGRPSDL